MAQLLQLATSSKTEGGNFGPILDATNLVTGSDPVGPFCTCTLSLSLYLALLHQNLTKRLVAVTGDNVRVHPLSFYRSVTLHDSRSLVVTFSELPSYKLVFESLANIAGNFISRTLLSTLPGLNLSREVSGTIYPFRFHEVVFKLLCCYKIFLGCNSISIFCKPNVGFNFPKSRI